jgi:hypothetical protein
MQVTEFQPMFCTKCFDMYQFLYYLLYTCINTLSSNYFISVVTEKAKTTNSNQSCNFYIKYKPESWQTQTIVRPLSAD